MKASTRERERLARERDILNAAVKLFCANGFEKTSMEDLANRIAFDCSAIIMQQRKSKSKRKYKLIVESLELEGRNLTLNF